jgi:hypothetical protein
MVQVLRHLGLMQFMPVAEDNLLEWWLQSRKMVAKPRRRAFDSFVFLVIWHLWLERNALVFRNSVVTTTCV